MTSSPLFSKTGRSDLRRDSGFLIVYFILFFFTLPIQYLFRLQNIAIGPVPEGIVGNAAVAQWNAEQLQNYHNQTLAILGMTSALVLLLVLAVVEAYHQFGFLHRSREVDYFHGLPQTRRQIYFARFRNGLISVLLPYVICLVLGTVCAVATESHALKLLPAIGVALVCNILLYFLAYSVAVTAVMLTGHPFTGIAGIAVLFFYFPAVCLLLGDFPSEWFRTYAGPGGIFTGILGYITELSPAVQAVRCATLFAQRFEMPDVSGALRLTGFLRIPAVLIAACLFMLLALKLYEMRPLERASEAMTFPKTERPVRIALTILAALFGAALLKALSGQFGWVVFGMLCALLLSHFLVEFVYRMDIRKIFSHKVEIGIMAVLCVLFLLSFRFDWYGYNRYLPKAEQVESADLELYLLDETGTQIFADDRGGMSDEMDIMLTVLPEDLAGTSGTLTDPGDIRSAIAFAEAGIASLSENEGWTGAYGDYAVAETVAYEDSISEEVMESFTIRYRLRGGRTVSRYYMIPSRTFREKVMKLLEGKDYRGRLFPLVYNDSFMEAEPVSFRECGYAGKIGDAQKASLLAAYREDVENLSFAQIEKEPPLGFLCIKLPKDLTKTLRTQYLRDPSEEVQDNLFVRYPVYPAFTRTVAVLAESGIDAGKNSIFDTADSFRYSLNFETGEDGWTCLEGVIDDPEEVEALREALIESSYYQTTLFPDPVMDGLFLYAGDNGYEDSALVWETEKVRAVITRLSEGEKS